MTIASKQRLLKSGGVLLHVAGDGDGALDARATVVLPGGRSLVLARVWRGKVRKAQDVRVWLGTTATMKRALRSAFAKRRTLHALVRVVYGTAPHTRTVTRTIAVSR